MICWKCGNEINPSDGMYRQEIQNQPTIHLCIDCEAAHGWVFSSLDYVYPDGTTIPKEAENDPSAVWDAEHLFNE